MIEHFQKVVRFLERSLFPSERQHLCAIAGETSLLISALLFELGAYTQARAFQKATIQAAKEARFEELEAAGWGWMSFTWTYTENSQEALHCIQAARHLARRKTSWTVLAWLAAIEAEIQAHLQNQTACLKALDDAESIQDSQEKRSGASFDRLKLLGYKGVCFQKLSLPGNTSAPLFLDQAQKALLEAVKFINPVFIRRRATLHTDLAGTYFQQGVLEETFAHVTQAIALTTQVKSQMIVERLSTLRHELELWKETSSLKNLDEQMTQFLTPGWYKGNV